MKPLRSTRRGAEGAGLFLALAAALSGFGMATVALNLRAARAPLTGITPALGLATLAMLPFIALHILLRVRRLSGEQIILPAVALLSALGLSMVWRLRGADGVWPQLRSLLLGAAISAALILRPGGVERLRRAALPISLAGLALAVLTAAFGGVDESGARLALKLGPLPALQTTELIKLALIVFLAWFAEREGRKVEGRARMVLGWLRLPPLRYFLPGALFVGVATLALVRMADYGAVLILLILFTGILYTAFETRTFATLVGLGAALALPVAAALALAWHVPDVIHYRFAAFLNPWSSAPYLLHGQPTGLTIAQGPGYQIQQSIYAVLSGGLTGAGLGFGSPGLVPLAYSDFIFAALVEEMGAVVGVAVLALFGVLILRIFRLAARLPENQVFERVLAAGIGIHLLAQVSVMVGGTLDLLPMTGVTIPFMSQGGMALLVNLAEVGLALALLQRLEAIPT
jgi:cell division protein FtsW (lipid II flippase)